MYWQTVGGGLFQKYGRFIHSAAVAVRVVDEETYIESLQMNGFMVASLVYLV